MIWVYIAQISPLIWEWGLKKKFTHFLELVFNFELTVHTCKTVFKKSRIKKKMLPLEITSSREIFTGKQEGNSAAASFDDSKNNVHEI